MLSATLGRWATLVLDNVNRAVGLGFGDLPTAPDHSTKGGGVNMEVYIICQLVVAVLGICYWLVKFAFLIMDRNQRRKP